MIIRQLSSTMHDSRRGSPGFEPCLLQAVVTLLSYRRMSRHCQGPQRPTPLRLLELVETGSCTEKFVILLQCYSSRKMTPWAIQDPYFGYPWIVFVDWDNEGPRICSSWDKMSRLAYPLISWEKIARLA